ncbi:MAG: hypothetical protein ABR576_17110 [Thermoanaerobaculia bacterium]
MACDHQGCRCDETRIERGNKKFCSERCAEMETTRNPEPHCMCGHPDCAAA